MTAAVRIENYTWRYSGTEEPAIQDVNLEVEEGLLVGVIGPNGSGKSTIAYSLNGLIPNQYNGIRKGNVYIHGDEVTSIPQAELCQKVGLVFSDPEAQFTAMTVEDEVVFGMENMGLSYQEIQERLDWVVPLTDIGELMEKPPYEVSGGQKQRVALAAVLSMRPPVLMLDEPTSMLDPIGRSRVFKVLGRLKEEYKSTIIIVEHSLENLIPLADMMALVYQGEVLLVDETVPFFQKLDYLMEHDIYPPGVLEFFHHMKSKGDFPGQSPLPQTVEDGAAQMRQILENQA